MFVRFSGVVRNLTGLAAAGCLLGAMAARANESDGLREAPGVDATSLGAIAAPSVLQPSPPPDVTPAQAAPAAAAAAPRIADRLPARLDAFIASAGPNPVGAADWRSAREAIRNFYVARGFAPVWTNEAGLTPAGRLALARLRHADEDALDLASLHLPDFDEVKGPADPLAEFETRISAAVVAYAMQASGARLMPSSISPLVTAKPAVVDPGKALADVANAVDPGETLRAFNPPQRDYAALRELLIQAQAKAPAAVVRAPRGPVLLIGMTDPRVPLIRARFGLGANGDAPQTRIYDAKIASAVAAFQKSRGLPVNGALTEATNAAIFGGEDSHQIDAIRANMEMWRWEPRDLGAQRIEVNVPDFTMRLMDGDNEILSSKVIVGKPDTPTPIFSNEVKYILVNPVWRVPQSIIRKEMMPKLAADPDYLTRHGFRVKQVGKELEVDQPPGEGNALGRILFMFPNEHAVYLHDTPSRGLFATARRAYSHGCVRVEQPMRLAEVLMGGAEKGWSADRVESLVGSNERTLFLPKPIPIHIEYFTLFAGADGGTREREDIYGLTARVAASLSRLSQD